MKARSAKQGIKTKKGATTSKYVGVYWHEQSKKWVASLYLSPKQHGLDKYREYIGAFDSEIEAAKAYNERAIKLLGENARLNNFKE